MFELAEMSKIISAMANCHCRHSEISRGLAGKVTKVHVPGRYLSRRNGATSTLVAHGPEAPDARANGEALGWMWHV